MSFRLPNTSTGTIVSVGRGFWGTLYWEFGRRVPCGRPNTERA